MIRDSEKGIGYLLGHEEPETKAQRRREIKRQIEGSIAPLSDPIDVFTSLPMATTVNLGTSNSLAHPKITPPVKTKMTDKEIFKFALEESPEPITKAKRNRMAREWITDKNSGNSKGAWKDFVKERKDELKKHNENIRYLGKGPNKDNPLSLKFPYNKVTGRFENKEGDKVDPRKVIKEQQFIDQRIEGAKTLQYVADNNTMYADQPKQYLQWDNAKEDYVDVNEGKKRKPMTEQLTELRHFGRNKLIERELRKSRQNNNLVRKIK